MQTIEIKQKTAASKINKKALHIYIIYRTALLPITGKISNFAARNSGLITSRTPIASYNFSMEWITDLIFPGNTSIASTLVLYSFVIAAGIYIGKLRVGGVSLGVTFVLFVGIVMGHFGYVVDNNILKFVRSEERRVGKECGS